MKNYYYILWVDAITKLRSNLETKAVWAFYSIIAISFAMSMKFIFVMAILQRHILGKRFKYDIIDIFPGNDIDAFLSFLVFFMLPFLVINYVFIFWNKRYEKLLLKYKHRNGKFFTVYWIVSVFGPYVIFLIGFIFHKLFN